MDERRWKLVKRLFEKASEVPPERLPAWLDAACDGDDEMRSELDELLAAADDVEPERELPAPPASEESGSVIGPYKLLQEIGEGGFGVVYMAEQERPVRRKVALKIIKLGMDTKQVVARFEAERQALALMEHPNIAKVLDGGATETGRPYFVMELVKGIPITEYCDQAQLDTNERLELFQQVCHAVQHAHHKGIIHRDLKPTNILVTLHDGRPVPKVIDFGIAKATDRRLTDKTLFTEFRQWIGTPDYMAPEQAELSGLDVDTRADVYSLGVLLYELLTGTKPFDMKTIMEKGYEEILRTIREVDPQRPSTRLSTMGDQLAAVSKKRHAAPASLGRMLRGDLDWIVMKSLEKDRARRYETASDLALDVQRHRDHEPVTATPPTAAYRLRKYLTRHRLGMTAAAIVFCGLLASAGLAYAGMREERTQATVARSAADEAVGRRDGARTARAQAQTQRQRALEGAAEAKKETLRAKTVLDLLDEMLGSADPDEVKGRNYTVRELLEDFDRDLGDRLKDQPDVEATVRLTLGKALLGLGLPDRAEPHLTVARELRAHSQDGPERASALNGWADLLHARGRYREAAETRERATELYRESDGVEIAETLSALSLDYFQAGRPSQAEASGREALGKARELRPAGHRDIRVALGSLGLALMQLGRFDEAERVVREQLASARRADDPREEAVALNSLSLLMVDRADYDAAERALAGAAALLRETFGDTHPINVTPIINRASIALMRGRFAQSLELAEQAARFAREEFDDDHPKTVAILAMQARAHRELGHLDRAEALAREVLAVRRRLLGDDHLRTVTARIELALCRARRADYAGALEILRDALARRRRVLGDRHPLIAVTLQNIAWVLNRLGRRSEAVRAASEGLALIRECYGDDHWVLANYHVILADMTGDQQVKEKQLRTALALYRRHLGDQHWRTANAARELARCLTGRSDEAETLAREALAVFETVHGEEHVDVANACWTLANVLNGWGRYAAAEPLARRALALHTKLSRANDRNRIASRRVLATTLRFLQRPREVLALFDPFPKTLQGTDLVAALWEVGLCRAQLGQYGKAEAHLRHALEVCRAGSLEPVLTAQGLMYLGHVLTQCNKLDEAETMLDESLTLKREAFGSDHPQVGVALNSLGNVRVQRGDLDGGERALEEAVAIQRPHGGQFLAQALNALAGVRDKRDDLAGAEKLVREAFEIRRLAGMNEEPDVALWVRMTFRRDPAAAEQRCRELIALYGKDEETPGLARALAELGALLNQRGRPAAAEPLLRRALTIRRRVHGDGHVRIALVQDLLGHVLIQLDKLEEAESLLTEALPVLRESPPFQARYADLNYWLGSIRQQRGKHEGAIEAYREALRSYRARGSSRGVAVIAGGLARSLHWVGRYEEAALLARESVDLHRAGKSHDEASSMRLQLGSILVELKRFEEAESLLTDLLEGDDRAGVLAVFGGMRLAQARPAEAEPLLRECLALRKEEHWLRYNAMSLLGESLALQRKFDEAEPLLREGYEKMAAPPYAAKRKGEALDRVIGLYEAWGKPDQAAEWRAK